MISPFPSTTRLDASRLLIASVGSTFAKDSLDVPKRFSGLRPVSTRRRLTDTLEEFLAKRIEELAMDIPPPFDIGRSAEWQQKFGSRRPAETALQLLDPVGIGADKLPRYAIVRWIDHTGRSNVIVLVLRASVRCEAPRSTISPSGTQSIDYFKSRRSRGPR
jgi:hypothetical protein